MWCTSFGFGVDSSIIGSSDPLDLLRVLGDRPREVLRKRVVATEW